MRRFFSALAFWALLLITLALMGFFAMIVLGVIPVGEPT